MPKRKEKLNAVERWVANEYAHYMDAPEDTEDRLFSSELGCRAVFIAINDIMTQALENDDEAAADACCDVIGALARCRLAWMESPTK